MTDPAAEFAHSAPAFQSAEPLQTEEPLHYYQGELANESRTVRIITPAPTAGDESIHDAFTRVAGQWHNPSTHPNVVTVHDRGRQPRPWIAVDLLDGESLETIQTLSPPHVRTLATATAEAVRNAALYNTPHLALAPRNIWIVETDDGIHPIVDDWGLERACRAAAGDPVVTLFTAPELHEDPTGGSERTDVYGLGAITYYALTGQPPSDSPSESRKPADTVTPPSALTSHPAVTDAVDDVVVTALAADPADRYDSVYNFKTAIERALPTADETTQTDAALSGTTPSQASTGDGGSSPTQPQASGQTSEDQSPEPPAAASEDALTYIENLRHSSQEQRQDAVFELLERAAEQPHAVAAHLPALLECCSAEQEHTRWVGAAVLGNLIQETPEVATPHIDDLIAALDDESKYVREYISTALINLIPIAELPTSPLLSYLERGGNTANAAIDVLAAIATAHPSMLSRDRLDRLATAEDPVVRAGAQYLLTLLATVDHGDPPFEPTSSGYYELFQEVVQDLPGGESTQFLATELYNTAIDQFLSTRLDAAGYVGMQIAKTPDGAQLVIGVEDPETVTESPGLDTLSTELEDRFSLEDPHIDLRESDSEA